MKQRLFTGAMIIALLVLVLLARQLSGYIFDAFILIITAIASYEMTNLLAKMNLYNNKYFAIAYPFFAYGLYLIGIQTEMKWFMLILVQLALIVVFVMGLLFFNLFNNKKTKNEIETRKLKLKVETFSVYKSIHTMFAYLYPGLLMLFFITINNLSSFGYLFETPVEYLVQISTFVLILTFVIPVFTDTFAYLTGGLFKGPKLCPKISPNKTISGAIGGVVWGTIGAFLVYLIYNSIPDFNALFIELEFKFWYFIILGFVISIVCQLGDMFESYLKRKANVKDSGNILPGHGGILDRIDSHLFCVPCMFIFLLILL